MSQSLEIATAVAAPLAALAAEVGWTVDLVTREGTPMHVRPARPGDEPLLATFFESLSPEDLRHGFLTGMSRVGHDQLHDMARNDDPHSISFLAIDESDGAIVATAMLVADRHYVEGEFALATRPDRLREGVSWTLLDHLVRYAGAAGIKRIKSIETSDDGRALQLEREMGFSVRLSPDDSTLMIAEKSLERS